MSFDPELYRASYMYKRLPDVLNGERISDVWGVCERTVKGRISRFIRGVGRGVGRRLVWWKPWFSQTVQTPARAYWSAGVGGGEAPDQLGDRARRR